MNGKEHFNGIVRAIKIYAFFRITHSHTRCQSLHAIHAFSKAEKKY